MFAYCSIFPRAYIFDVDEVILLWMAEQFLYLSNLTMPMEKFGHECFEELVSRSLFEESKDESRYTMTNMVHELAVDVTGEFCCTLGNEIDLDTMKETLKKVHHLSFSSGEFKKFDVLQSIKHLRTLLGLSLMELDSSQRFFLPPKVLRELIPQLQFLRVLNLSNYSITEVPKSVGALIHLRYLNFSRTDIIRLPEEIGDLHNLQSLLLHDCEKLHTFPDSVIKLINLRHLDIRDTPCLLPLGIGELKNLQSLSNNLSTLQGRVSLEGLHKVTNVEEANEASLWQKKDIDDLEMEWSDVFDSRDEKTEYQVLEKLNPHNELKTLKIMFYGGEKFLSWVGDQSFVQLTELTLRGCKRCTQLPSLGHLQALKKLFVESMKNVATVGPELLGSPTFCAFPKLDVLEFKDMEGWEKWSIEGDGTRSSKSYHCLHEISLSNCVKLNVESKHLIPSLEVIRIQECSTEVLRSMVGLSSSIVMLTLEKFEGPQLPVQVLENLVAVENLSIKCCNEMVYLWISEPNTCNFLPRLQKLEVSFCKMLVTIVDKDVSMESVKEVNIHDCEILTHYECPNSIERLVIWDCPSLSSLKFHTPLEFTSTLKLLKIGRCDNLEQNWVYDKVMSPLESLDVVHWPNLKSFPEKAFVQHTRLTIRGCNNVESIPDNRFASLPLNILKSFIAII
ncbi:putative disease resistance RPP13-like protein 1 isoform X2 [Rutidosis leptorrhynchoides]|uniref:putative disease resistance RPP13-like protein 1 isoform X2 n=1 Tax=Rutidosis leptorrhynchoides TaxID=125765 RepID=UPI003A9A5F0C